MPNARVTTGFSVLARMIAPTRVFSITNHVSRHTTNDRAITNRRYFGNTTKPRFTTPDSTSGGEYGALDTAKRLSITCFTKSCVSSVRPNVSSRL